MNTVQEDICALCGGPKQPGLTTFSAELGFGVVVIRNVPALVCGQCGENWIEDPVAAQIETVIQEAKRKHAQIEVMAFT